MAAAIIATLLLCTITADEQGVNAANARLPGQSPGNAQVQAQATSLVGRDVVRPPSYGTSDDIESRGLAKRTYAGGLAADGSSSRKNPQPYPEIPPCSSAFPDLRGHYCYIDETQAIDGSDGAGQSSGSSWQIHSIDPSIALTSRHFFALCYQWVEPPDGGERTVRHVTRFGECPAGSTCQPYLGELGLRVFQPGEWHGEGPPPKISCVRNKRSFSQRLFGPPLGKYEPEEERRRRGGGDGAGGSRTADTPAGTRGRGRFGIDYYSGDGHGYRQSYGAAAAMNAGQSSGCGYPGGCDTGGGGGGSGCGGGGGGVGC